MFGMLDLWPVLSFVIVMLAVVGAAVWVVRRR